MSNRSERSLDAWAEAVRRGERRALSRAITLIESSRADHRAAAGALLDALHSAAGGAFRIGLTGAPGVGKSSFIEPFGALIADSGRRLAVLAVDPSSARTGGSILGDKTRMERLSRHPNVYIRPSPSLATLGGVARRTREAIRLVEAWGADVVIVETVGVGQSEALVAEMTDLFALLVGPGGGDELQGVKRGVMEMADLVLVNKADGALAPVAEATSADYGAALRLMRRRPWDPPAERRDLRVPGAMAVSAHSGRGLEEAWALMTALDEWRVESGWRARRRREQDVRWLRWEIGQGLEAAFDADPAVVAGLPALEAQVASGALAPDRAATQALALFLARRGGV